MNIGSLISRLILTYRGFLLILIRVPFLGQKTVLLTTRQNNAKKRRPSFHAVMANSVKYQKFEKQVRNVGYKSRLDFICKRKPDKASGKSENKNHYSTYYSAYFDSDEKSDDENR
jgi:hypothetical protein